MFSAPNFAEFFRGVHGYEPFPWQSRLAERVLADGWPHLLDLPTGSGKTTALDIGLFTLALKPHAMPRRIVLVVDRRIVVDQGAEHARKIRRALMSAKSGPLKQVADRLRALFRAQPEAAPFAVAVLRGGAPRDDDWAKRPDQPVLGLSTVDQVGSRLLFRGYGIGKKAASIHAGLMGNDTLILLDEVHLSVPFAETLKVVGERYMKSEVTLPTRFRSVEMSATPGRAARGDEVFSLDDQDRAHPVLRQRLGATKPTQLQEVVVRGDEESARKRIADAAAQSVRDLLKIGTKTIGVVLNRVDTARRVFNILTEAHPGPDVFLLTGRMRPVDRDKLLAEKLPLVVAGRSRDSCAPAIVVSTQCIEAGADLDFDALVSELASFDALKQRFGRLDRRGEVTKAAGLARGVILARSDMTKEGAEDPVYGKSLPETWNYLKGRVSEETVDMGVDALDRNPPDALEKLIAPRQHAPVLMPGHLDAWSQTSPLLRPAPDPDVSLWLHGPDTAGADVSVVWRADLAPSMLEHWFDDADLSMDWPACRESVEESLTLVRPSSLEAMPLAIWTVKSWLAKETNVNDSADVDGERSPGEFRAQKDPTKICLARREDRWGPVPAHEIRPGDMIVVPAARGGIGAQSRSFDPNSTDAVIDLGDLAQLRSRGIVSLRTAIDCVRWIGINPPPVPEEDPSLKAGSSHEPRSGLARPPVPDEELSLKEERERLREWGKSLPNTPPEGFSGTHWEYIRFREAFTRLRGFPVVGIVPHASKDPPSLQGAGRQSAREAAHHAREQAKPTVQHSLLVAEKPQVRKRDVEERDFAGEDVEADDLVGEAATEDDNSSSSGDPLSLKDHSLQVSTWASTFVEGLHLPDEVAKDIVFAAWLHDVGKADPRFQRMLLGGQEVELAQSSFTPRAKSNLPKMSLEKRRAIWRASGLPDGYRHELMSLAMLEASGDVVKRVNDLDLVLHLVASHHGWCRPFAPAVDALAAGAQVGRVALHHLGAGHEPLDLACQPAHNYAVLDGGVSERFWRLNQRYGPWGLAWLEAILRLADHRASEEAVPQGRPT